MSNQQDQGRYARMVAFWGLLTLVAYGCFHGGGLVTVLDGWLGDSNTTYVKTFPLLGSLKTSTVIALGITVAAAFAFHSFVGQPRVAKTLVETEEEMHKVTWPTWPETWSGTLAVIGMVVVLFLFLTAVDLMLAKIMGSLWGSGA